MKVHRWIGSFGCLELEYFLLQLAQFAASFRMHTPWIQILRLLGCGKVKVCLIFVACYGELDRSFQAAFGKT